MLVSLLAVFICKVDHLRSIDIRASHKPYGRPLPWCVEGIVVRWFSEEVRINFGEVLPQFVIAAHPPPKSRADKEVPHSVIETKD